MKLEFKILWFDDQPRELDGPRGILQRFLLLQGFNLKIRDVSDIKDLESLLPKLESEGSPDLILMDWSMGNGTNGNGLDGSDVAKAIRRKFKYQEIVFYSAATPGELRQAIFEKGIDGVFCINRKNLPAETKHVINNMLRKVLDLNQMRGIVMSHVSEFDDKISVCLSNLHSKVDGELQKKITDEFHKVIKNHHESKLVKLGDNSHNHTLDTYKKMSVLNTRYGILKRFLREYAPNNGQLDTILDSLDSFESDVLIPRNALAHAKEVQENGKLILKHNNDTYDETKLSKIRQALLIHEDNLQCIHDSIQMGLFTPTCTD
jgi:CheY-like chemotaxis protein